MNKQKSFCDQISALLLQNKLDDAETMAKEAKALFPDECSVLERYAYVKLRLGMYLEAEEAYRDILGRFSGKAFIWVGLINALLLQNKLDDAESAARGAKALFPDEFPVLERCAYIKHRQGMYPEAEEAYRNILGRFPGKAFVWVGLINVLLLQNKFDDAEAVAGEAKALFPDDFSVLERCAYCHLRSKKYTNSLKIYKSIENRLTSPLQYKDFASVLCESGEYDESKKVYRLALKRFNKHPMIVDSYSKFLLKIQDYQSLLELIDNEFLSCGKKTVLIIGNCQSQQLSNIFDMHSAFKHEYTAIKGLPGIYEMPVELQKIVADYVLPKVDLLITQNILNPEYLLKTDVVKGIAKSRIVFPTLHFLGYFPDVIGLKQNGQTIRNTPLTDSHSALVLVSFVDGVSQKECSKQLLSGDWIEKDYDNYISFVFEALHEREKFWDIKITNYIYNNYKNKILFHTVNHPDASLLHKISNSILNTLNLDELPPSVISGTSEIFSQTQWIINNKVCDALSLRPTNRNHFVINNIKMSVPEFVSEHYRYYENNPSVVEGNIDACRNALFSWQK